jgi:putative hemolysin
MELEIGLALLLLIVLSLLATVDMAFAQLSDVRLRRLIGENGDKPEPRSEVFLQQALENRARFSFALSATIQILLVVVAVLITSISLSIFPEPRLVLVGLVAGLILAGIFRQLIPLFISTRNPEGTLLFLLPIVRPFFSIMAFIADPFQRLFDRSRRKEQIAEDREEEEENDDSGDLQALIDVGEAEGILEEEEGELIHSIIEFGDTRVSEVMTPRPDIVAIPSGGTLADLRALFREQEYSRFPVYNENLDNIVGMVFVKDLVKRLETASDSDPLSTIIRPATFVPETKRVPELLKEFQRKQVQVAIVVDEYGGTAGLVTIEDLLEEIVGEIRDEYDVETEPVVDEGKGSFIFSGKVSFDELRERLGLDIEPEGFETVGGYILTRLGRVPAIGETFELDGLAVDVLEAERRRIHKVRFRKAAPAPVE